jgi:hypothetical protein
MGSRLKKVFWRMLHYISILKNEQEFFRRWRGHVGDKEHSREEKRMNKGGKVNEDINQHGLLLMG